MFFNRRAFLRSAAFTALGGAAGASLLPGLSGFQAQAADTSGYKALVCLFLLGGMDNHDTLIPYDQASYDAYAGIRAPLLSLYAGQTGGNSRARERLLPLSPENAADFGGRQFALPEQFGGIHALFEAGQAAIVGNVGPLVAPLTRADWDTESVAVPKRLFSHNDQQATWMASAPEGAQYGWGGRFADCVLLGGSRQTREFTTITSLGNELFLTGEEAKPYQVGLEGATQVELLQFFEGNPYGQPDDQLYQDMRRHFAAMDFARTNLIERDIAAAMRAGLDTNEAFNTALASAQPITTPFPTSFLGQQLQAVARTISIRDALLMNRQIFFVAAGGFDTHSAQASDLPALQTEIDAAVTAFYTAMTEFGLAGDVTLFTATDFGRTLAINGDGTDHGWGSHQFVIGDAVQGGRIYGDIPPTGFDHDFDAGGGRLIPTLSVEQYAAALGNWFGLSEADLVAALPNLSSFSGARPAFI